MGHRIQLKTINIHSTKSSVGFVDVWGDNHVLIFYPIIYYRYAEYTDELQLDDLQVAG
jgi:hypothetical protein